MAILPNDDVVDADEWTFTFPDRPSACHDCNVQIGTSETAAIRGNGQWPSRLCAACWPTRGQEALW